MAAGAEDQRRGRPEHLGRQPGRELAEAAVRHGVYFTPGDNHRIAGWMQCHYRLQFDEQGYPRMYVFRTCRAFLRTVPLLTYDPTNAEDVNTALEDHVADEWRYFCMSRPIRPLRPVQAPETVWFDPLRGAVANEK